MCKRHNDTEVEMHSLHTAVLVLVLKHWYDTLQMF